MAHQISPDRCNQLPLLQQHAATNQILGDMEKTEISQRVKKNQGAKVSENGQVKGNEIEGMKPRSKMLHADPKGLARCYGTPSQCHH